MADRAPWQETAAGDVAAHAALTHAVHGIADTAQLAKLADLPDVSVFERVDQLGVNLAHYCVGDGIADDTAGFQAAINALPASGGKLVGKPGAKYKITDHLVMPPATADETAFVFDGQGAWITSTAAVAFFDDAVPASLAAAVTNTNRAFLFRNWRLVGNQTAGQIGVRLIGTYLAMFESCRFIQLDQHTDLIFSLAPLFIGCRGRQSKTRGFYVRSATGVVTGATDANSGSNVPQFIGCRDYASAGQLSQFEALACSGMSLDSCITEGANPVNAIVYNANSNTVDKVFTLDNHHFENTPTTAHLKLNPFGGHCYVQGPWEGASGVLIDASGSAQGVIIASIPYLQNVPAFKHDATNDSGLFWVFHDLPQNRDPIAAGLWVGGVVPQVVRFDGTSDQYGGVNPVFGGGKGSNALVIRAGQGDARLIADSGELMFYNDHLHFFGFGAAAQQVLNYSRSGAGETAALAQVRAALAAYGLIIDSTTA